MDPARSSRFVRRCDAVAALSERVVDARLGRTWQVILPGVYATDLGPLDLLDRYRAALLYAGPASVLTDTSALRMHGSPYIPEDEFVRVLIPNEVHRTSRQFVVVRRTPYPPNPLLLGGMPVAPLARAICDLTLRSPDERSSLAVAAAAVQQGRICLDDLKRELQTAAARGRPRLKRLIGVLSIGIRSAPEQDFRLLVCGSRVLPEPLWNPWLRMPDGRELSPDALFPDAGLVHETNGREFHAEAEPFEDMQRRSDALVAAGLTVLHNSPRRIKTDPRGVLVEVEACYQRLRGAGLPAGVTLISSHAR